VTIAGDRTRRKAIERVVSKDLKKLPVDDLRILDVVTLTDVAYHYSDVEREIHELDRRSFREPE
jgi:CBS-domain-containing membrane protein